MTNGDEGVGTKIGCHEMVVDTLDTIRFGYL